MRPKSSFPLWQTKEQLVPKLSSFCPGGELWRSHQANIPPFIQRASSVATRAE